MAKIKIVQAAPTFTTVANLWYRIESLELRLNRQTEYRDALIRRFRNEFNRLASIDQIRIANMIDGFGGSRPKDGENN